MVRAVAAALLCVACQGQGSGGNAPGRAPAGEDASAVAITSSELDAATAAELDAAPRSEDLETTSGLRDVPDPGRLIADLGAIPAWQAVVDRAQLLGRRGQHGVVFGRVGPALLVPGPPPAAPTAPVGPDAGVAFGFGAPRVGSGVAPVIGPGGAPGGGFPVPVDAGLVKSPYVWLIDDTEGNGTLGIRIALGDKASEGDRIAAGGAWQLDAERRWFWKPDTVQALPPAPASELKDPQPPAPSHVIASGDLPAGVRSIGVARDGDAAYFQIIGLVPATNGDGWQVADQLGSPVVAVMNLPGERPSYGGQDMRAADERWQLKRGQTYWVRLGKLRKRGADKPALVNARTAPIRVM